MRGRGFAAACAALVAATLVAAVGSVESFSTGKADSARDGCGGAGCHGAPVGPQIVIAMLDGLPEAYTPGANYTLTVRIDGGPPVLPVAQNQGGFALELTSGALRAIDDTVQAENATATHTEAGNDQRQWQVEWLAPLEGVDVDWFLSVNAVNGNGIPDPGDQWAHAEESIPRGAAPAPAPSNTTGNATGDAAAPPPARTPGPGGLEAGLVGAAGALLLAARRRR